MWLRRVSSTSPRGGTERWNMARSYWVLHVFSPMPSRLLSAPRRPAQTSSLTTSKATLRKQSPSGPEGWNLPPHTQDPSGIMARQLLCIRVSSGAGHKRGNQSKEPWPPAGRGTQPRNVLRDGEGCLDKAILCPTRRWRAWPGSPTFHLEFARQGTMPHRWP